MEDVLVSLVVIIAAIVLAPLIADNIPRIKVPVVVVEIALGIIIGPQVLGLAELNPFIDGLALLGLAFLFFLAGFEIDFDRIRGRPLKLAGVGWLLSIALAVTFAAILYFSGTILMVRYVAIALTTTAIGALMPILRDSGDIETPFGTLILAAGAVGEFGPIVLVALVLSTENSQIMTLLLLIGFGALVLLGIRLAQRWRPERVTRLAHRTMHSSAQLPMRLSVLVLIALVSVAIVLKLEFLLGAFAAGVIVAQALKELNIEEMEPLRVKYEGISFGFLIPIFFVVSGMNFDLHALLSSPKAMLELPLFLVLFLVVRGVPALLLYRKDLGARDRKALGLFMATALPLIVAIAQLGLAQGQMLPQTAAALVGAGMLSVFIFPLVALSLRQRPNTDGMQADSSPSA